MPTVENGPFSRIWNLIFPVLIFSPVVLHTFSASSFLDGPWSRGSPFPPPPVLAFNFKRDAGASLPKLAGGGF